MGGSHFSDFSFTKGGLINQFCLLKFSMKSFTGKNDRVLILDAMNDASVIDCDAPHLCLKHVVYNS